MEISAILASAAERLAEDESLRSNLDDKQAKALLDHTLRWLENRLKQAADAAAVNPEQEIAQAIQAMRSINMTMKSPQPPMLQETLEKIMPLAATAAAAARTADRATQQKASILRRVMGKLRSIWRRATTGDKTSV